MAKKRVPGERESEDQPNNAHLPGVDRFTHAIRMFSPAARPFLSITFAAFGTAAYTHEVLISLSFGLAFAVLLTFWTMLTK